MEEQKKEQEKLSYEKLEEAAVQLQQRCVMLENKLRSIDMVSVRLNYLLRVVEIKGVFSEDFVAKCSKEIEDLLTLEEPEDTKSEE
jgi:hypothetical protein